MISPSPLPLLRKHAAALVGLSDLLEEHEVNEEAGSHEHGFHLHVHVQGELDAKVVRVGEDFLQETRPLLADATDGFVAVFPLQLEVDVPAAVAGEAGPLQFHQGLLVRPLDGEPRQERVPVLFDVAYGGAGRRLDLHLLQAAGTPAGDAAERPDEADDLSVHGVLDLHVEAAQRAAAVPGAAVVLLFGLVDLLAQAVLYLILVVGLKAEECFEELHFLVNQDLVNLCEVLKPRRDADRS